MKKKLRILYVTTEISPFNAESPLSEFSYHFTKYCRAQGHDIRVVMPKYNFIRDRKYNLREVIRLREIPVPIAGRLQMVAVKSAFIPDTKVQVYFMEDEKHLSRDGITINPETGKFYQDSDERFIVFPRAVVEMLKILSWQPQLIHLSDWTSALTAYYINTMYAKDEFYSESKVFLSLADYQMDGSFPRNTVFKAGINPDTFTAGTDIELDKKFCYLKAGAINCDKIVVTGEEALEEFENPFKKWFKSYLKTRNEDVSYIPFGIDTKLWNPEKDEKISANYSHKEPAPKLENKKMLLDKYDIKVDPSLPLIGCVWENGDYSVLKDTIELLKSEGLALVIADKTATEDQMSEFVKLYPEGIGAVKLLTNLTIKQIVAGSDILIFSPNRYKDILHFKAAKYGAVSIAPKCGFFADDIGEGDDKLDGYLYKRDDSASLCKTLNKSIDDFKDDKNWLKMMKKMMKFDSGWNKSSRVLLDIYNELT